MYVKKKTLSRPSSFETSEIRELGFIPNSFLMATLCRERYLTREEMKTQYQKGRERKKKGIAEFCFLCLNQQKEHISETLVKYTME